MATARAPRKKRSIKTAAEDEIRRPASAHRAGRGPHPVTVPPTTMHPGLSASAMLSLQKTVGNRAVARMVDSGHIQRGIGKKIANVLRGKKKVEFSSGPSAQSVAYRTIFAGNDAVTGLPWVTLGPNIIPILNHDFGIPKGGMSGGYGAWGELTPAWVPKPETMKWVISEESGFSIGIRSFMERFFVHKGWMQRRAAPSPSGA